VWWKLLDRLDRHADHRAFSYRRSVLSNGTNRRHVGQIGVQRLWLDGKEITAVFLSARN
jgi:hypothetical protein